MLELGLKNFFKWGEVCTTFNWIIDSSNWTRSPRVKSLCYIFLPPFYKQGSVLSGTRLLFCHYVGVIFGCSFDWVADYSSWWHWGLECYIMTTRWWHYWSWTAWRRSWTACALLQSQSLRISIAKVGLFNVNHTILVGLLDDWRSLCHFFWTQHSFLSYEHYAPSGFCAFCHSSLYLFVA